MEYSRKISRIATMFMLELSIKSIWDILGIGSKNKVNTFFFGFSDFGGAAVAAAFAPTSGRILKMSILQIIIVIVALLGAFLNARKNVYGFCLWLISNGYWGIHNICIKEYAQAFLYFVFLGISIYGIYKWQGKADGKGQNRSERR